MRLIQENWGSYLVLQTGAITKLHNTKQKPHHITKAKPQWFPQHPRNTQIWPQYNTVQCHSYLAIIGQEKN